MSKSINQIIDEIIPLLNPKGYSSYPDYEDAISKTIKKLGYDIAMQTGIKNGIRERKEFLKPIIQEIKNKILFLGNNEARLNKWNKERFTELKSISEDKFNLVIHERIDQIISSNFTEEEIKKNNIVIHLSEKEFIEKERKRFKDMGIPFYVDGEEIE